MSRLCAILVVLSEVFEYIQSSERWNGMRNNTPALSDTYIWVLELHDVRDDGQALSEVPRGEVVLLQ